MTSSPVKQFFVVALAAAALGTGCGDDGDAPGSGGLDPRFVVGVPKAGQAIVRVEGDEDGDRVCDQAKLGDFEELAGVTTLIIKTPGDDQGRNADGYQCALTGK